MAKKARKPPVLERGGSDEEHRQVGVIELLRGKGEAIILPIEVGRTQIVQFFPARLRFAGVNGHDGAAGFEREFQEARHERGGQMVLH